MPLPNTEDSLVRAFADLGLGPGMTVMVHASLGQVGWTEGGAGTVVRALLARLGPEGTLVMPAATPELSHPNGAPDGLPPVFDAATTPSSMGAISDAFRSTPGTLRSAHPLNSVCARGPRAQEITGEHALRKALRPGSPHPAARGRLQPLHLAPLRRVARAAAKGRDDSLSRAARGPVRLGRGAHHGHRRQHPLPRRGRCLRRRGRAHARPGRLRMARHCSNNTLRWFRRALERLLGCGLVPHSAARRPRRQCRKVCRWAPS